MKIWLLIGCLSIITFMTRYLFFSEIITYRPNDKLKKFLSFSAQSILTALWVPIVFKYHNSGIVSYADISYLLSAIFASILGVYRVNMLLIVILSLSLFFTIKFDLWKILIF